MQDSIGTIAKDYFKENKVYLDRSQNYRNSNTDSKEALICDNMDDYNVDARLL